MRPLGTSLQLETRRLRAIEFLHSGMTYRQVADKTRASLSSVVRWRQDYQKFRENRPKTETGSWPPRLVIFPPKEIAGRPPVAESAEFRILHGRMDTEPGTPGNRAEIRGALHFGQYLENIDRIGLELPEACEAGAGEGRKGHRPLETLSMAAYKKKPKDLVPTWSFLTKAGSFWCRTWSGLGLLRGKRRNCDALDDGGRFLPSPLSAFPPSVSGWHSMRGFIATRISSPLRSCVFSDISSNTSVGRWCFSGTLECRTKESWLKTFWESMRAFGFFAFRAMPRNSIRMSMCGASSSARWPIAFQRIFAILSGLCIPRSKDCGNPKNFCGAVFMHPICHGFSVPIS